MRALRIIPIHTAELVVGGNPLSLERNEQVMAERYLD